MSEQTCPKCGAERVHRSRVRGPVRVVAGWFHVRRFRCHGCGRVEWRYVGRTVFEESPKRKARALVLACIVLAIGAVTGLGVIYLSQSP